MKKSHILIVEHDFIAAKRLKHELSLAGYKVLVANSAAIALHYIEQHFFDLMITDIHLDLENMDCINLVKKLNKKTNTPTIYLTSYHDDELFENIAMTNHSYYLTKPCNIDTLIHTIRFTICKHNLNNTEKTYLNHNTTYDMTNKLLTQEEKEIKFTVKENLFLMLLIYRKNQIVSSDEIMQFIWGVGGAIRFHKPQFVSLSPECETNSAI